jgi:recombinational DNA repair protein (RecF pathway)
VRENLDARRIPQAAQAASFVAAMLHRLFPEPQPVPARYAAYVRELSTLVQDLPDPSRRAALEQVRHLATAPVDLT